MPDPISTTPPAAVVQPVEPTAPATSTPVEEEPFDKERAMATITKLREFEKTAKQQAKQLADYQAKEKEAQLAQLSEVEKLKTQFAERDAEYKQAQQEIATLKLRQAVEREAQKLGFNNPEDAYLLADMNGVEMDDDGSIKGVENALKELLKQRPYLAKAADKTAVATIGTPRRGATLPAPNNGEAKKSIMGIRL